MRLELHRQITADISRIMNYYEDVAGQQLADEFYAELRTLFQKAADSPETYNVRDLDLRRVDLERFPHHFFSASSTGKPCAFWLFVTTSADHRSGFTNVEVVGSTPTEPEN